MRPLHGLLDDILGDSPIFAPDSPLENMAQTQAGRAFSPNSPNSPTPYDSPLFAPDSPLGNHTQTRVVADFSPNSPNSPTPYDSPHRRKGGENSPHIGEPDPNQPQTAELWVIAWTPSGKPLTVKAKDQQHAEWIQKMNPAPRGGGKP